MNAWSSSHRPPCNEEYEIHRADTVRRHQNMGVGRGWRGGAGGTRMARLPEKNGPSHCDPDHTDAVATRRSEHDALARQPS